MMFGVTVLSDIHTGFLRRCVVKISLICYNSTILFYQVFVAMSWQHLATLFHFLPKIPSQKETAIGFPPGICGNV